MTPPPQFTLDWPYGWQTRDGRDVEIYCTDAPGIWPIHGRINGSGAPLAWNICGRFRLDCSSAVDLINRPAPIISVPSDKLHNGIVHNGFSIVIKQIDPDNKGRPVKWFYEDEMEIEK